MTYQEPQTTHVGYCYRCDRQDVPVDNEDGAVLIVHSRPIWDFKTKRPSTTNFELCPGSQGPAQNVKPR